MAHVHSDDHDDGHGHDHGHGHEHSHAPENFDRAFATGVALNVGFVVIEVAFGVLANSLALLADAGHNLSDVLGLLLAWGASVLARRRPTQRHTYGLRRSSVLAALVNALVLLVAVGAIAWEALLRVGHPESVASGTVISVASVGIIINGFTAWLFMSGKKSDVNIRGAYLHMAADAAISLGVVVAAIAMRFTGYLWLDPAVSLAIAIAIGVGTWSLLRESVNLALDAVLVWVVDHEELRVGSSVLIRTGATRRLASSSSTVSRETMATPRPAITARLTASGLSNVIVRVGASR